MCKGHYPPLTVTVCAHSDAPVNPLEALLRTGKKNSGKRLPTSEELDQIAALLPEDLAEYFVLARRGMRTSEITAISDKQTVWKLITAIRRACCQLGYPLWGLHDARRHYLHRQQNPSAR